MVSRVELAWHHRPPCARRSTRGRREAGGRNLLEVRDAVVADADRPGEALLLALHEGLPHAEAAVGAAKRRVHQEQVDRVDAKVGRRRLARGDGLLLRFQGHTPGRIAGPQLGRDVYARARDARRPEALGDRGLVVVALCGVDVTVSLDECRRYGAHAVGALHHENTETDTRHRAAISEVKIERCHVS